MLLIKRLIIFSLAIALVPVLSGCSVKVEEADAEKVMQAIFKERKRGNLAGEMRYYARDEFKIVPFDEVESTLYSVIGSAGRLQEIKALKPKVQKRNQLGKGLTTYLVLSYQVTYTHLSLLESYFFYGDSEKPKLVYMTLQL